MRVLFELPYPGYLRIYGATVVELAARGHTVLLAYDDADKRRDASAAEIESLGGVEIVPSLATVADRRAPVTHLRLAADYLHYVGAAFASTPHLRRRMDKFLPPALAFLRRLPQGSRTAAAALRVLLAAERAVPPSRALERRLAALAPDRIVVTPLIGRGASGVRQVDTVKAARSLRIPVAMGVTSWDHLTTKGVVKSSPDRVIVWNEVQRREAVELHRVPVERIVATGAQLFDQWFARAPALDREPFANRVGLAPGRRYVLYVGSSPNIAEPAREEAFVRRWIDGLRSTGSLAEVGVLVRPHPGNAGYWREVDLSDVGGAVAPRERPAIPMSRADEDLYFDSIHHAAAVVGINTSAIIESLIQRRPVLTIRAAEFRDTQEGTLHFHYLVAEGGGCVRAATTLTEHLSQLEEAISDPEREREAIERFLRSFVRPHGLERPATPILADAIEQLISVR